MTSFCACAAKPNSNVKPKVNVVENDNNEIVEIDGNLRYMVDGQFSTKGIFEREGKLYYAGVSGSPKFSEMHDQIAS